MFPANRFAPTNPNRPEYTAQCMRCGFYYYHRDLEWQYQWTGPHLTNIRILVCVRTCLDVPAEQLRTIKIGPDGLGPKQKSPTFYQQQNQGGVAGPGTFPPLPDDTPP